MMAASLEGPRGLMIEGANTSAKFLLSMRLLLLCDWTLRDGRIGGMRDMPFRHWYIVLGFVLKMYLWRCLMRKRRVL